jgi:hypothetical protein
VVEVDQQQVVQELQVKEITAVPGQDHLQVVEEVALVRLAQAAVFLGTVEMVYLLHYQDLQ